MTGLRRLTVFFSAALALSFAAGCGSGGTGSALSATGGRASLDVFVTDGFTDQFKQVLATLFKIELTSDGVTFQTVFEDTAGRTLDLASLASTAELLASVTVPAGTYTQARITFGDHVTLVSNNGTSTSVAVDTTVGSAANGQIAVTVSTPAKVQTSATNSITVDFKLAEFQLVGNVLRPSISCGNGNGDHPGEVHTAHLGGTVTNLNGTTSFVLQNSNGRTTNVTLTSTTTITSGQTGAAITLANGQNVIVEGTFAPTTSTLTATSVTLNDFTTIKRSEASGTVASVNGAAASFVLTVVRAEGIMPTAGTITVVTDANTRFEFEHDHDGNLAAIITGNRVAVSGSFDTTTQTLTARSVGLH
jgi:hypothetical protein